jgi:hypothetical protein
VTGTQRRFLQNVALADSLDLHPKRLIEEISDAIGKTLRSASYPRHHREASGCARCAVDGTISKLACWEARELFRGQVQ